VNWDSLRRSVKHFGLRHTLYDVAYRAMSHVVYFKILKGVAISRVDPAYHVCDARYTCLFIAPERLRELGRDAENEMPPRFLDEALGKGDECYGIIEDEKVASYGWYARTPTALELPDLRLHFSTEYVYMYKGFTHPEHRGQRLHAIGMTKALESYLSRGHKGLVSYVEANNFGSLKSVYRMGYSHFGDIFLVRISGRYFIHAGRGCSPYGFRVEWVPPAD
jgi:hypothetical protein